MTVIAGKNTYGLIFSSGNAAGVPSGDIVYLVGKLAGGGTTYGQKIKHLANGNSHSTKDGVFVKKLNFPECYIHKDVAGTNTAEFNIIEDQFDDWHDMGDLPIYCWVYNFVDSDYVALGREAGVQTDYLKGYITGWNWELTEGNLYYLKGIAYENCRN